MYRKCPALGQSLTLSVLGVGGAVEAGVHDRDEVLVVPLQSQVKSCEKLLWKLVKGCCENWWKVVVKIGEKLLWKLVKSCCENWWRVVVKIGEKSSLNALIQLISLNLLFLSVSVPLSISFDPSQSSQPSVFVSLSSSIFSLYISL